MNKGQGIVEYALILVLVAVVVIVILAVIGDVQNRPSDIEVFEAAYHECMMKETLTEDQCNLIALQRIKDVQTSIQLTPFP